MLICDSLGDTECWMTFWTGTTAIGTLLLVAAAVVAGVFSFRLLRTERDRDDRAEIATRAAQASLIASWADCEIGHEYGKKPGAPTTHYLAVFAVLRNASQLPVYDVSIDWKLFAVGKAEPTLGRWWQNVVPPDATPSQCDPEVEIRLPLLDPEDWRSQLDRVQTILEFRDAHGHWWRRGSDGRLEFVA